MSKKRQSSQKCQDIGDLELPAFDDIKPLKLEFSIGGYDLPYSSDSIKLENGKLIYQFADFPNDQIKIVEVVPSDRKWANFQKKLDAIGVWKWKKNYVNRGVCDGTQWDLEIDYGTRKIKVYGSNWYPDSTDQTDLRETPEFKAFLHALKLLLGGAKTA